jgi:hypothetical protein
MSHPSILTFLYTSDFGLGWFPMRNSSVDRWHSLSLMMPGIHPIISIYRSSKHYKHSPIQTQKETAYKRIYKGGTLPHTHCPFNRILFGSIPTSRRSRIVHSHLFRFKSRSSHRLRAYSGTPPFMYLTNLLCFLTNGSSRIESPSRTLRARVSTGRYPREERDVLVAEHKVSRVSGSEEDPPGVSSLDLRDRVLREGERGGGRSVAEFQYACGDRRR